MTPVAKRWLLGVGLVATLALVWLAPQDEVAQVRPKAAARGARPQSGPATTATAKNLAASAVKSAARPDQLQRPERVAASEIKDLFRSSSWFVPPPAPPPPPPAPPPPPPPPPSAPPLPFTYLGQIVEDQKIQVILSRGDRVLTIFVGDNIDASYKVESLKGGTLTLVYLPLDIKQTLATGVSQ